jgi:arylsulfatase
MSGKWHVTKHVGPTASNHNWPLQRGFDRFYGTIIGAGSFYDPATLCRGNTFITPENDPGYHPKSFYYSDEISDNAVRFLADHAEQHENEPYFLYVAYTSAHWPMHAPDEDIAKYKGKYDEGYEPIRVARFERAKQLRVLDKRWHISPAAVDWKKTPHKDWETRCMEVYAAMVDRTDQGIGDIVRQIEKDGDIENTIIIYLQDNGGCAEGYGRNSLDHRKPEFDFKPFGPNDLQSQIWPPMQTRDGRWVRTGPEAMAGAEDTFVAYGTGWANTSNTPFRGYKHDGLEGGISTPFIVHWPSGIDESRRGTIVRDPTHLIDVMPTIVDVSGAEYPSEFNGEAILAMEGVSLTPALGGQSLARNAPLGFEHHGNLALRDGKWKIVSSYRRNRPTAWQLFDMEADRTELNDLSETNADKKSELVAKWHAWADHVGVQPWPIERKR